MAVLGFAARDDAFVAHLDEAERDVLLDVVDQVVELLGGLEAADAGPFRLGAAPLRPPDDPAVRRLLPDASRADPEVAAEFRRLTEPELRASKITNLLRLRAAVAGARPRLVVAPTAAPGVAAALTDVRLVLADRLGLRTDADVAALDDALAAAMEAMEAGGDDVAAEIAEPASPASSASPDRADRADRAERADRAPAFAHLLFVATVYELLGLLQESLVGLMLDGLPDDDEPDPTGPARPR